MKLFKRKLWEALSVVLISLLIVAIGAYNIATGFGAVINNALGISTSDIAKSDADEYQYFKRTYADDKYADLEAYYRATCEEVEAEGLVLMENKAGALPLNAGDKVSLFFSGSVDFNYGSSGSSSSDTSGYKDLKTALTEQGVTVNPSLWDFYKANNDRTSELINEVAYSDISAAAIASIPEYNVAILVFARNGGEGADVPESRSDGEDKSYLSVSKQEESVLKGLTALKAEGKVSKIIVLLNSSSPIELDFMYRDGIDVDACMWVGNVGVSGINAVAKALIKKDGSVVVPSGKLSDTYLRDNFSSPAMAQQSFNGIKSFSATYGGDYELNDSQQYYGVYNEGIYVGYRYYETRYTDYVTGAANVGEYNYSADVAYPFGYGTSYTTFTYDEFNVTPSADGKTYEVSVKVTNSGATYTGKEVVQVYLQKPYTQYDKDNGVEKAAVELVGYAKTAPLAPNASEVVKVTVDKEQFVSYDANGAKTYILDAGKYYLTVANGAHEAANNVLAKLGYTPANTAGRMDAEGDADMVYETESFAFDSTTYKTSSHTGKEITNRFDQADLNKNTASTTHVTYVSRNDWTGTWPTAKITIALTDGLYAGLDPKKAIESDGSSMPKYGASGNLTVAALRGKAYDDEDWDKLLDQMTFAEQTKLITNGYFVTEAIPSVGKPDTKEQDGPNGLTKSKSSLSFPSEGVWASSFNDELIEKVGDCLAEDALAIGVTGLYGGGVNIHRTPFGGRTHEYFSEDPYLTGAAAVAETTGLQRKGVIAHIKHFAFNDEETNRDGISIWLNEQEAREIMLCPFEMVLATDKGGVIAPAENAEDDYSHAHAVMSSFNRVGTDWAGACKSLMIDVLIDEWGFDGYNITDMANGPGAQYMTYQNGIANGTNVYLGSGSETSLNEFKDNATFANRMRESTHRVLYAVANYSSAMNGMSADTVVNVSMAWWQSAIIGAIVGFAVLSAAAVALYVVSLLKEKKAAK